MNSFFLLFIGLPALEIFLMIKIGGKIGALSTVSLIFLTAIIGVYFAKLEGIKKTTRCHFNFCKKVLLKNFNEINLSFFVFQLEIF